MESYQLYVTEINTARSVWDATFKTKESLADAIIDYSKRNPNWACRVVNNSVKNKYEIGSKVVIIGLENGHDSLRGYSGTVTEVTRISSLNKCRLSIRLSKPYRGYATPLYYVTRSQEEVALLV